MERTYWVYVLASGRRGALYVGVTNDLARRVALHRSGKGSEHVARYRIFRLVLAEPCTRADEAIAREKQLKKWRRAWKIDVIEEANPRWDDLHKTVV